MPNHTLYAFSDSDQTNYALNLFSTLGLSQYDILSPYLGLDISSSPRLREISRHHASETFALFEKLLAEARSGNLKNRNPYHDLWYKTVEKLEQLNEADTVLSSLNIIKRDEEKYRRKFDSLWDIILFTWIHQWDDYPELSLSDDTIEAFKPVIIAGIRSHQRALNRVPSKVLNKNTLDDWDQHILYGKRHNSWLSGRASLHQSIVKWLNIFEVLTLDEIRILDEWGLTIVEANNHSKERYISLYELYHDFKGDGLL